MKLASNEGPYPPLPAAIEAMGEAASELNRYPDGGSYRLHAALAARHGVHSEEVCVGSGADGCIDMLSQAALGAGDEVVCGWPSFPSYPIYAAKQGAVVRKIPLLENRYDLEALASAITPQTKLVYVCHPNNPTGTMNTKDELDAFFTRVPPDVLVVIDQAYFEYIDRDDYPDAVEAYFKDGKRVVVLRTFSKIYGLAGLRVGYAVGPEDVCAAMAKMRRPFDLTTTAQVAALASLGDADEIARRRELNTAGLAELTAILERARARSGCGGRGQLRLHRPRRGCGPALRAAPAAGSDRPPACRFRRSERDPAHRRHARGAPFPRRGSRPRAALTEPRPRVPRRGRRSRPRAPRRPRAAPLRAPRESPPPRSPTPPAPRGRWRASRCLSAGRTSSLLSGV